MEELLVRPMMPGDVDVAERVSDAGFLELDTRLRRVGEPQPLPRSAPHRATWVERTRHLLGTDPGGCWVAEVGGDVVGLAVSFRRETLWCLATYAVLPRHQGRGVGRPLLAAALQHGQACLRGMLSSSADPRAVRSYHRAGFALHPQMSLAGTVDRSTLPVVEKVREGSAGDIDLMDSLDRLLRGAGHGVDHELMLRTWRLLVSDTSTGRGYVYVDERRRPALLAASDRRTASRLLWAALAESEGPVTVGHLTGANQWALDVGLAARLELRQEGYLGLRGMKPPSPYVHSGALL